MGCDFWWKGSIPDPGAQEEAVSLYQRLFDLWGNWKVIEPRPTTKAKTRFLNFASHPPTLLNARDREDSVYSHNFYGVAPHLQPGMDARIIGRAQLVFDRSDGGKMVSVVPVDMLPETEQRDLNPELLRNAGISFVVAPGGYVRLLGYMQCRAFALFLTLLRHHLCPDLDAKDDVTYLREAREQIQGPGFPGCLDELPENLGALLAEFTWNDHVALGRERDGISTEESSTETDESSATEFVSDPECVQEPGESVEGRKGVPRSPASVAAEGSTLEPMDASVARRIDIDFLPLRTARLMLDHEIDWSDEQAYRRYILSSLASLLRRARVTFGPEDDVIDVIMGASIAISKAWREDGYSEILSAGPPSQREELDRIELVFRGGDNRIAMIISSEEIRELAPRLQ